MLGCKARDPLRGLACLGIGRAQLGSEVFPGLEHRFESGDDLGGEGFGPAAGLVGEGGDVRGVVGVVGGGVHHGCEDAGGGLVGGEAGGWSGFFGEGLMVGGEVDWAGGGADGEAGEEGGEEVGHVVGGWVVGREMVGAVGFDGGCFGGVRWMVSSWI